MKKRTSVLTNTAEDNPKFDNITLRLTTIPVPSGVSGSEEPLWILNPAPELSSYAPRTGIPVAINDSISTRSSEAITFSILANDFLDGQPIPVNPDIELGAPDNGRVSINADQTVTYTPDAGFVGIDQFRYRVSVGGEVSNWATVSLRVLEPLLQPMVLEVRSSRVRTQGTDPLTVDLLALGSLNGDRLPDNAELRILSGAANGAIKTNPNNTVTYVANQDFIGTDHIDFAVAVEGAVSNEAVLTIEVVEPLSTDPGVGGPSNPVDPTIPVSSSGGGCTIGEPGRFDPVLPGLVLAVLGWLGLRRVIGSRS